MQHDPKLAAAVARGIASSPYGNGAYGALTALCTACNIPPEALAALARGEAVVVPAEELDQLIKRDHGCERAACADQRGEFCVCGRRLTKIAASPYAREARDE